MSNMSNGQFSRRQLLRWAGAGLLFNTAGTLLANPLGKLILPVNAQVGAKLLRPQERVPTVDLSHLEDLDLGQLIVNSYRGTPDIDPDRFRLAVQGQVLRPQQFSLGEIQQMPFQSEIMQHVCVEGWAAIVQWGGVNLGYVLDQVGLKPTARYVYFSSADGYYESWDLASARHPQTILAYQKNDGPLPAENGGPLRLATPIKLGYKLSKWVTEIIVTDRLLPRQGYWEDQGYDWFAGI
jgi:DMSO/TMAO reductase YedYZ molybdopterin-dependent catalytic subunit